MSQLDLVQFFPTLVWSVVCFVVFYFVFNVFYVMVYYKNMRMRGWLELKIKDEIVNKYNSLFVYKLNSYSLFTLFDYYNN